MAAFSYQQNHQFHLDPLLIQNVPFKFLEKDHHTLDNFSPTTQDSTSHRSVDQRLPIPDGNFSRFLDHQINAGFSDKQGVMIKANYDGGVSEDNEAYNATPESSSAIVDCTAKIEIDEQLSHQEREIVTKKKRIFRNVVSGPSSSPPKHGREEKSKKQKQCNEKGKKHNRAEKKEEEKQKDEEAPKDYIHVRARRGQATDSHSLAERVRREKISERMKMLQKIVPGCDKVAGKALMLDEIINYVQSLQNQVEFLSMKLSSISPVFYDFGAALDDAFVVRPEGLAGLVPRMQDMGPTASFPNDAVISTYPNGPLLIPPQDTEGILREVEDQRQKFHDLSGYNNLCSFN